MLIRSQNRLRREIWFINAGLLSDTAYNRLLKDDSIYTNKEVQTPAAFFLSIDYLVHYLELLSINSSKILISCIKNHLNFVERFITRKSKKNRYISSQYWDAIFTVCDKYDSTVDCVEKQFCIDAMERICNFLTSRSRYWVNNNISLSYLKIYGRKLGDTVVYNSFIIPNFCQYKDPLLHPDQKFFEKIENDCFCKILLKEDQTDCRIGDENMILEVLFDFYKGNFLGFLDYLTYIVKILSPTKYFIKSLRTITQDDSMYFTILSDLPLKELRLVEKCAYMGQKISPFLHSTATSKVLFNLIVGDIKEAVKSDLERSFVEYEELEYWNRYLSEDDIQKYKEIVLIFRSDYEGWLSLIKEWTHYKNNHKKSLNHLQGDSPKTDSKYCAEIKWDALDNDSDKKEKTQSLKVNSRSVANGSTLSLKISAMESLKMLSSIQNKLICHFDMLYVRKLSMRDQPENFLNHILRIMLRCDTEFEAGDEQLATFECPVSTIHDMLKQYYNFDLKQGTFYTKSQTQTSLLNREFLQQEKENQLEKAKQRQMYLENRRIINEKIENLEKLEQIKLTLVSTAESVEEEHIPPVKIESDRETTSSYENLVLNGDILFGDIREKLEQFSPSFKKELFRLFGELSGDTLQLFNETRITQLRVWNENIKGELDRFKGILPFKYKPTHCNAIESYKSQINKDQVDMIYTSVSTNIYVSIKLFSGQDPDFDDQFPKILVGQGIQIKFLNEINKPLTKLPMLLSFIDRRHARFRKQLNHTLCVLSFDIYLICASLSTAMGNLFDQHREELRRAVELSNNEIKDLFEMFEFEDKLDEAKSLFTLRLHKRTKDEIGSLLKLSQDLRRFNEFIFHNNCCKWRQRKCIHILYASMELHGSKKCQEPFLRRGGDRRVKKIETKGNCIITMRLTTHPTTGVNVPFIEIFYDFFKGNHFATVDLLRTMLSEDRGSMARIMHTRYLISLPYGELWIVQDVEWLRSRASHMFAQQIMTT